MSTETSPDATAEPNEANLSAESGQDTRLDTLLLPERVWSFIERRGLETVGDVIALDPASLHEKNFGRRSLADLRAAVEQVCGTSWERARAQRLAVPEVSETDGVRSFRGQWELLQRGLDGAVARMALATLRKIPIRMRRFAQANGILTVEALLALPYPTLLATRNVGRVTLRKTLSVLGTLSSEDPAAAAAAVAAAAPPPPADLDHYTDLVDLWRAETSTLSEIERQVLHLRSGLDTPARTLRAVGASLGFTGERARQIEAKAVAALAHAPGWTDLLTARLLSHLQAMAVPLEALVQDDPWLAPVRERPRFFKFVSAYLLDGRFHLVQLGDTKYLSLARKADFHKAWSRLHRLLHTRQWPAPRSVLDAAIASCAKHLGSAGRQWLAAQAAAALTLSADGQRVLNYGLTRDRRILAWLLARGEPVAVREVHERFGEGPWPEDVVFLSFGLVTVTEHLRGFTAVSEALVSRCVQHMKAYGPTRQWSSTELARVLADDLTLPPWFGPWPLYTMCLRSQRVRCLGRGIVTLPSVKGTRLPVPSLLTAELEAAGTPLRLEELERRVVVHRGLAMTGFSARLQKAPFLETTPGVYGLNHRDLPGGLDAAARAVGLLVEALTQRDQGLSLRRALARLVHQDTSFASWTPCMLRSVCRQDPRLFTTTAGSIGLEGWESTRIPSKREITREALAEGQGRALITEIQRRIAEHYDDLPSRQLLAVAAWTEDARIEGAWLVSPTATEAAPPETPVWAGLPADFTARWAALQDLEHEGEDLAGAVDTHVQRSYLDAAPRAGFDMARVLRVRQTCHSLLARAASVPAPLRSLARAAVRYFVLDDHVTWGTPPRGLDAHQALLDAVTRRLDEPQPPIPPGA